MPAPGVVQHVEQEDVPRMTAIVTNFLTCLLLLRRQLQAHPFEERDDRRRFLHVGFGVRARQLGVCWKMRGALSSTACAGFAGRLRRYGLF